MTDTLHLITQATKPHIEWYWAFFVIAGFLIKISFDIFDANEPTDIKTPDGKRTIGSWILSLICSILFAVIIISANITSHALNDFSFAMYLICYTLLGFCATYTFKKLAVLFKKKVDEKAGITITETKTTDIKTTGLPETPKDS